MTPQEKELVIKRMYKLPLSEFLQVLEILDLTLEVRVCK